MWTRRHVPQWAFRVVKRTPRWPPFGGTGVRLCACVGAQCVLLSWARFPGWVNDEPSAAGLASGVPKTFWGCGKVLTTPGLQSTEAESCKLRVLEKETQEQPDDVVPFLCPRPPRLSLRLHQHPEMHPQDPSAMEPGKVGCQERALPLAIP